MIVNVRFPIRPIKVDNNTWNIVELKLPSEKKL